MNRHVVDLRQCALFVDSDPIKRGMLDAADYIQELREVVRMYVDPSDVRPIHEALVLEVANG